MGSGYDANSGSGVWTEQQWGAAGGKGTVTDDGGRKALRLEKQPGKLTSWKMFRTVAVEEAKNLLSKGGEIAVRFKIPDGSELVNGQFVLVSTGRCRSGRQARQQTVCWHHSSFRRMHQI